MPCDLKESSGLGCGGCASLRKAIKLIYDVLASRSAKQRCVPWDMKKTGLWKTQRKSYNLQQQFASLYRRKIHNAYFWGSSVLREESVWDT